MYDAEDSQPTSLSRTVVYVQVRAIGTEDGEDGGGSGSGRSVVLALSLTGFQQAALSARNTRFGFPDAG